MRSGFIRLPFYYNGNAVNVLRTVFNAVSNAKDAYGSRIRIPGYIRYWACMSITFDSDGMAMIGKDGYSSRISYGLPDLANQLKVGILFLFRNAISKDEFTHSCTKVVIEATATTPAVTVKDIRYIYECCHNQARRFCHYTEAERKAYDGAAINPFIIAAVANFKKKADQVNAEIAVLHDKNEQEFKKASDLYYAEDKRLTIIKNIKLKVIDKQKEYMLINCRPMPNEELEKITSALYAANNILYPEAQVAQPAIANA